MAFHNIPPNGFPDLPDMEEVEAVVKDVTTLKTSVAGLASDVSNLSSSKANQITIAPFFNAEASYDPGDIVYYNGLSYRCVNAHEGEWDADDFAATTIAGELDALKNGLTNGLATEILNVTTWIEPETGVTVDGNLTTAIRFGNIVVLNVVFTLSDAVSALADLFRIAKLSLRTKVQQNVVDNGLTYTVKPQSGNFKIAINEAMAAGTHAIRLIYLV